MNKTLIERLRERTDIRPAIYSRVSTKKQLKEGYSLERQIDRGKEVIKYYGIVPEKEIEIYVDGAYTGTNTARPDWQRLRQDIKSKVINLLIVVDTDRVGRETYNNEEFKKFIISNEAEMFFINDPSMDIYTIFGSFQYTLKSAMGTMEVSQTLARSKEGLIKSFEKGNYANPGFPFGYRKRNKKLYIHKEEAEIVKLIHYLYVKQCVSILQVLAYLQINEIASQKKWDQHKVRDLLKNTVYSGIVHRKDLNRTFSNIAPIIISIEMKNETLVLLKERTRSHHKRNNHIFHNKVYCADCNKYCINDTAKKKYRYYLCSSCKQRFSEIDLNELVAEEVILTEASLYEVKEYNTMVEKLKNLQSREQLLLDLLYKEQIEKRSYRSEIKRIRQERRLYLQNQAKKVKYKTNWFDQSLKQRKNYVAKYIVRINVSMKNKTLISVDTRRNQNKKRNNK